MVPYSWLEDAAQRLESHIRQTPLTYDPHNDLYLKWENHQLTGSFKARGALNKVLSLQPWEQEQGLVTASAGNHGQGVALAGNLVGCPVKVFASDHAVPAKIQAMRDLGAELILVPGGYGEAEAAGLAYVAANGGTWISPYNDGQVIAGQGTLGIETWQQLPPLPQSCWIVPVGGGGLISGIGAALKSEEGPARTDEIHLIGVQSEASAFAYHLFHDGTQENVVELDSLADGLAGPVEQDSLTIPLMRRYLDDLRLVSEQEIARAITYAWEKYQERLEGSAAVALAAALTGVVEFRPAVIILSGGNIQPEMHQQILAGSYEV